MGEMATTTGFVRGIVIECATITTKHLAKGKSITRIKLHKKPKKGRGKER